MPAKPDYRLEALIKKAHDYYLAGEEWRRRLATLDDLPTHVKKRYHLTRGRGLVEGDFAHPSLLSGIDVHDELRSAICKRLGDLDEALIDIHRDIIKLGFQPNFLLPGVTNA